MPGNSLRPVSITKVGVIFGRTLDFTGVRDLQIYLILLKMKSTILKDIAILAITVMFLTSCLNKIEDLNSTGIAEFLESTYVSPGTVDREILEASIPASFVFKVTIASSYVLDKDTKVTLALDNSLIDTYNTANKLTGTEAAIPVPPIALTVPSYQVIVPAGSTDVDWTFTIDASKLPNPGNNFYVVPAKIVSAENGIIPGSNFSSMLVRIFLRNEFDGIYTMRGFIMRPGDTGGLEGYFKGFEYSLITIKSNTVKMDHGQLWANGTLVGDIDPGWTITINKTTPAESYPVTLVDENQGSSFKMVDGYPSRYDVAAKTFYWSVLWGTATPKNRGCTDTLVFARPRL